MLDIEKRLSDCLKNHNDDKKDLNTFQVNGNVIPIKSDSNVIEILNPDDFKKHKDLIFDMVNKPLMKGIRIEIKKFVCYMICNEMVLDAIMDKTEKTYYVENIVFRIHDLDLIRIRTSEDIFVDQHKIFVDKNTLFFFPNDDALDGIMFETDDFLSTVDEGLSKKAKVILNFNKKENVSGEKQKIRYSSENRKLFIS